MPSSTTFVASAAAFSVVKFAGAAYLIFLGIRTIVAPARETSVRVVEQRLARLYADGVIVAVFNPKTALFFLAFLPQFVNPARGPVTPQILVLGLCFIALALCTDGGYALAAGSLSSRFGAGAGLRRWPRYAAGSMYIGLGVASALAPRHHAA